jgi:hypothetical protein
MIFGLVCGALLGFCAGLFTFKVKARWCPECGATTTAERTLPPGRVVR